MLELNAVLRCTGLQQAQYDWDAATTIGFLTHYNLTKDFKMYVLESSILAFFTFTFTAYSIKGH